VVRSNELTVRVTKSLDVKYDIEGTPKEKPSKIKTVHKYAKEILPYVNLALSIFKVFMAAIIGMSKQTFNTGLSGR
jgi:hypothetical protein